MKKNNTILIGIGNPNMGDDGIGIEIVNNIKKQIRYIDTEVLYSISFDLLDKILGYNRAIIVDAAEIGLTIGDYLIMDYKEFKKDFSIKDTHGINIFNILSIGYELFSDNMPNNIVLFLIQTGPIECFSKMISDDLRKRMSKYIQIIKNLI